jgi:cellulose synthase/poly-beta-1,6-N-acetylglucosamine synthase-like glycosyltransferase
MILIKYRNMSKKFKNVSVFQLPQKTSLGNCLNFAISKAKYNFVAKFDDDDYYAPQYISSVIGILNRKDIDVIGKRSFYLYLKSRKTLYIRFPNNENKYVRHIAGGTIIFKKKVFKHVKFSNVSLGEDYRSYRKL